VESRGNVDVPIQPDSVIVVVLSLNVVPSL